MGPAAYLVGQTLGAPMLGFLATATDGLDWRRWIRLIDAALAGIGALPRLPLTDTAELSLDFEGILAFLATVAFGLDRQLLLPFPGPPLGIGRLLIPPAGPGTSPVPLIPAAPGSGVFHATPNAMDDQTLQLLEEGRLGTRQRRIPCYSKRYG